MTAEFKCFNCNKRFYITGITEKALNSLVDAATELRSEGYENIKLGAWKVIQNRAKCCLYPSICIVHWSC